MTGREPRIIVENVRKQFRIPVGAPLTLKQRVLHPLQRPEWREFQALHDVSFEVADGEFFGIVGRNGCGKSTLLKLLAGIYRPDTGSVQVEGRVAPLIELGVGFNQELSARDNVYINGTLLGLTRRELVRRFDEIVEFAELDGFMDLKLRNFSSGMVVRLAFAIAVLAESDILLADEVLAVGDERFQQKCFEVFRQRRAKGQTIVFVTHDMDAMQQFCDRALLLDHGREVIIGDPRLVARAYRSVNAGATPDEAVDRAGGSHAATLLSCTVNGSGGTVEVPQRERIEVAVRWRIDEDVDAPILSFSLTDRFGRYAVRWNTHWAQVDLGQVRAGDEVTALFAFDNLLAAGTYDVSAGAAADKGSRLLGLADRAATVQVASTRGIVSEAVYEPAVDVEASVVAAAAGTPAT
jgi:ABC-type polysaccharide/polyol phosphate transport system ATPase subunit